jgi:ATP-dependent Zn protease
MTPEESDLTSFTKEKALAQIDVSLGGHAAEKLFIGSNKVTSGLLFITIQT